MTSSSILPTKPPPVPAESGESHDNSVIRYCCLTIVLLYAVPIRFDIQCIIQDTFAVGRRLQSIRIFWHREVTPYFYYTRPPVPTAACHHDQTPPVDILSVVASGNATSSVRVGAIIETFVGVFRTSRHTVHSDSNVDESRVSYVVQILNENLT